MDVAHTSRSVKHVWLETCHMIAEAFRVHKNILCQPVIIIWVKLSYFLGLLRTSYRGPNYRTNKIIIEHLAPMSKYEISTFFVSPRTDPADIMAKHTHYCQYWIQTLFYISCPHLISCITILTYDTSAADLLSVPVRMFAAHSHRNWQTKKYTTEPHTYSY